MYFLMWLCMQACAARSSLEAQLAASRSEVSALTAQLAELRGSLAAARESAVAAETAAARLQEDRVRLSKVGRLPVVPTCTSAWFLIMFNWQGCTTWKDASQLNLLSLQTIQNIRTSISKVSAESVCTHTPLFVFSCHLLAVCCRVGSHAWRAQQPGRHGCWRGVTPEQCTAGHGAAEGRAC